MSAKVSNVKNDALIKGFDSVAAAQWCSPSFLGCSVCVSASAVKGQVTITLSLNTPFGNVSKSFNFDTNVSFTWQPFGRFKITVSISNLNESNGVFSFDLSINPCVDVPILGWKCFNFSHHFVVPVVLNGIHNDIDDSQFSSALALNTSDASSLLKGDIYNNFAAGQAKAFPTVSCVPTLSCIPTTVSCIPTAQCTGVTGVCGPDDGTPDLPTIPVTKCIPIPTVKCIPTLTSCVTGISPICASAKPIPTVPVTSCIPTKPGPFCPNTLPPGCPIYTVPPGCPVPSIGPNCPPTIAPSTCQFTDGVNAPHTLNLLCTQIPNVCPQVESIDPPRTVVGPHCPITSVPVTCPKPINTLPVICHIKTIIPNDCPTKLPVLCPIKTVLPNDCPSLPVICDIKTVLPHSCPTLPVICKTLPAICPTPTSPVATCIPTLPTSCHVTHIPHVCGGGGVTPEGIIPTVPVDKCVPTVSCVPTLSCIPTVSCTGIPFVC